MSRILSDFFLVKTYFVNPSVVPLFWVVEHLRPSFFPGKKAGRVRLSTFYKKSLYSHWRFTEKAGRIHILYTFFSIGNVCTIDPSRSRKGFMKRGQKWFIFVTHHNPAGSPQIHPAFYPAMDFLSRLTTCDDWVRWMTRILNNLRSLWPTTWWRRAQGDVSGVPKGIPKVYGAKKKWDSKLLAGHFQENHWFWGSLILRNAHLIRHKPSHSPSFLHHICHQETAYDGFPCFFFVAKGQRWPSD